MSNAAALYSWDLQQFALHSAHAVLVDIQGQPVVGLRTSAQFSFSCVGLLLGREFQFILGLSSRSEDQVAPIPVERPVLEGVPAIRGVDRRMTG